MDYKRIYEPQGDVELMAIRVLFDEHGIRYTVEGEYMRSTLGGVGISDYSCRRILVWEEDYEDAAAILREFLGRRSRPTKPRKPGASGLFEKIWIVVRAIVLGIFFPITLIVLAWQRKRKTKSDEESKEPNEQVK